MFSLEFLLLCFQWLFSSDVLMLNPGDQYFVSVYNIPKPELGHSNADVSRQLKVDGELNQDAVVFVLK